MVPSPSCTQQHGITYNTYRVRHSVAIYGQLLLFCDQSMRHAFERMHILYCARTSKQSGSLDAIFGSEHGRAPMPSSAMLAFASTIDLHKWNIQHDFTAPFTRRYISCCRSSQSRGGGVSILLNIRKESVHGLKGLALPRTSHSCEIALSSCVPRIW